jgi:hypothetical protein
MLTDLALVLTGLRSRMAANFGNRRYSHVNASRRTNCSSNSYIKDIAEYQARDDSTVYGLVADVYHGSLSMVINGKEFPPAFGKRSPLFLNEDQDRQQ